MIYRYRYRFNTYFLYLVSPVVVDCSREFNHSYIHCRQSFDQSVPEHQLQAQCLVQELIKKLEEKSQVCLVSALNQHVCALKNGIL